MSDCIINRKEAKYPPAVEQAPRTEDRKKH